jgi:hypothetical protein
MMMIAVASESAGSDTLRHPSSEHESWSRSSSVTMTLSVRHGFIVTRMRALIELPESGSSRTTRTLLKVIELPESS